VNRPGPNASKVLLAVGALVLVAVAIVAGYAIGRAAAPSETEASRAEQGAYQAAYAAAREQSEVRARQRGERKGLPLGRGQGRFAGVKRGRAAGETEVGERDAATAASAVESNVQAADEAFQGCASETPGTAEYARCINQSGVPTGVQPNDPAGAGCPPGYHFDPSGGDACLPD
jgi:hypothetical protein